MFQYRWHPATPTYWLYRGAAGGEMSNLTLFILYPDEPEDNPVLVQ